MAGFLCLRCGKLVVSTIRTPNSVTFTTSFPFSARLPRLDITSKEILQLMQLPIVRHGGTRRQVVISHPSAERRLTHYIKTLARNRVLGFDTESRPVFTPKAQLKPCLVQLASSKLSVIWRLRTSNSSNGKFPMLCSILESKDILKVGHASCADAVQLLEHHHINTRNFFDTVELAYQLETPMKTLKGLTAIFLGLRLTKGQQMSNWESAFLTESQVQYASADAWASIKVYSAMLRYSKQQGLPPLPAYDSAVGLLKGSKGEQVLRAWAESSLKTEEPPLGNTVVLQTSDHHTHSHALSCQQQAGAGA